MWHGLGFLPCFVSARSFRDEKKVQEVVRRLVSNMFGVVLLFAILSSLP